MSESKSHKTTSNRIAKKYGVEYNNGKVLISNPSEQLSKLKPPIMLVMPQVSLRHRGPTYIAGTNKEAVQKALDATKGTTIGVMDNQGNIVKQSTRKK